MRVRDPKPLDMSHLPDDVRADILRARIAPTMAEAASIFMQALDRAGIARPVLA